MIEEEERDLDVYIENRQSEVNLAPLVTGFSNDSFMRAKDMDHVIDEEEFR